MIIMKSSSSIVLLIYKHTYDYWIRTLIGASVSAFVATAEPSSMIVTTIMMTHNTNNRYYTYNNNNKYMITIVVNLITILTSYSAL